VGYIMSNPGKGYYCSEVLEQRCSVNQDDYLVNAKPSDGYPVGVYHQILYLGVRVDYAVWGA